MTDKQIYGATKNNKVPGVARRAVQLGSSWQRGQSAVRVTVLPLLPIIQHSIGNASQPGV